MSVLPYSHESMVDIVKLFSTLVDIKGKITIEGINSQVWTGSIHLILFILPLRLALPLPLPLPPLFTNRYIMTQVLPLTPEEEALYAPITFDPEEYRSSIGHNKLIHDRKEDILMHRWRYPSLSIHGLPSPPYSRVATFALGPVLHSLSEKLF